MTEIEDTALGLEINEALDPNYNEVNFSNQHRIFTNFIISRRICSKREAKMVYENGTAPCSEACGDAAAVLHQ